MLFWTCLVRCVCGISRQQKKATKSYCYFSMALTRLLTLFRKYYTPEFEFRLRIYLVAGFVIYNIYKVIDNRHLIHNVIALVFTTCVVLSCMLVVLMVGIPPARSAPDKDQVKDKMDIHMQSAVQGEPIKQESARIFVDEEIVIQESTATPPGGCALEITASPYSSSDSDLQAAPEGDPNGGESSDPKAFSGFGHKYIRKYSREVVGVAAVGFCVSICAAIFYLQLAYRRNTPVSFSTIQDTLYMCTMLYLSCSKWFIIIILLMRRIVKSHNKKMNL